MTRDEIRGLIGGYATGSLSEAERRTLFEAALEDQELFDDLAREQALKEALELPGARQRLVASLQPKPWWTATWVWAATGAAAIAIITGIILLRPAPNREIARVELPPVQVPVTAAPATPLPEPVPPPVRAQKVPAPAPARGIASPSVSTPAAASAPIPAEPLPPREPIPAAPKQEQQQAGQQGRSAAEIGTGPAPAPFAPRVQAFAQGADSATAAPPVGALGGVSAGVGGGGGGGGRGGRGGAAAGRATALGTLASPAAPRFAFDYLVTPEGVLRITPAMNGFLSVEVSNGTSMTPLFRNRSVPAGSVNEIPLPPDSITAIVTFSLREMNPTSLVTGALDLPSGTKSDPNPTADTLLVANIPVTR